MAKSAHLHPHLDLIRTRNQTTAWIGIRTIYTQLHTLLCIHLVNYVFMIWHKATCLTGQTNCVFCFLAWFKLMSFLHNKPQLIFEFPQMHIIARILNIMYASPYLALFFIPGPRYPLLPPHTHTTNTHSLQDTWQYNAENLLKALNSVKVGYVMGGPLRTIMDP